MTSEAGFRQASPRRARYEFTAGWKYIRKFPSRGMSLRARDLEEKSRAISAPRVATRAAAAPYDFHPARSRYRRPVAINQFCRYARKFNIEINVGQKGKVPNLSKNGYFKCHSVVLKILIYFFNFLCQHFFLQKSPLFDQTWNFAIYTVWNFSAIFSSQEFDVLSQ